MTVPSLVLKGHLTDLGGGFNVRRLLPDARCRSVGPFIFFDHFGPVPVGPADNFDVRPHPHIGLATVTYLFEGAMMHRDSLGSVQLIEPGAINWMTAGRGIVHSERRPEDLNGQSYVSHGLQLWCALPAEAELTEPSFAHTPAASIPELSVGGSVVRVLVGDAFGVRSPVDTLMPTLYLDIQMAAQSVFDLPAFAPQQAVYLVSGSVQVEGAALPLHMMRVLDAGAGARLSTGSAPARLVVIGGDALDGPRHMWWNFVSSDRARIERAADDWAAGRFHPVPGEAEHIPLPPHGFRR